jgi:hypothetical protein
MTHHPFFSPFSLFFSCSVRLLRTDQGKVSGTSLASRDDQYDSSQNSIARHEVLHILVSSSSLFHFSPHFLLHVSFDIDLDKILDTVDSVS